jgi:hypothetical protein
VAATSDGGCVWMASFASITFTVGSALSNKDTTGGSTDHAIVKLTSAGAVSFAVTVGGTGTDVGNQVFADTSGLPYSCGHFTSASVSVVSTALTNTASGTYDIYVAKFTAAGAVTWAKSFGGSLHDTCTGLAVDTYIAGYFASTSSTFGTTTLTNTNTYQDAYIAKLTSAGAVTWAKSFGGTLDDSGYGIACLSTSSVFFDLHFDSASVSVTTGTLTNSGTTQSALLKLDPTTGTVQGTVQLNGVGNNVFSARRGIVLDSTTTASPKIYAAGSFMASTLTISSVALTNSDSTGTIYDAFIAKISL